MADETTQHVRNEVARRRIHSEPDSRRVWRRKDDRETSAAQRKATCGTSNELIYHHTRGEEEGTTTALFERRETAAESSSVLRMRMFEPAALRSGRLACPARVCAAVEFVDNAVFGVERYCRLARLGGLTQEAAALLVRRQVQMQRHCRRRLARILDLVHAHFVCARVEPASRVGILEKSRHTQ